MEQVFAYFEPWQVALVGAIALIMVTPRLRRFAWHSLANLTVVETPRVVNRPWVIDGDTIDDLATDQRYRLANIDTPETGDNARCRKERQHGEWAKWAAVKFIRNAREVAVRRTFRTDRYGRRVAFVEVDGEDLGKLLMQQGLARPWRGSRVKWCGKRGGLSAAAKRTGHTFSCQACRRWR